MLGDYQSLSGYIFDCEHYCVSCAEQVARERGAEFDNNGFIVSEEFQAIFPNEEVGYIPSCGACGEELEISLTPYGISDLKALGLWTEELNMQYFGTIEIE